MGLEVNQGAKLTNFIYITKTLEHIYKRFLNLRAKNSKKKTKLVKQGAKRKVTT